MREFAKKLATFGVCSLGLGAGFGAGLGFWGGKTSFSTPVKAQAAVAKSTDEQNVIRVVKSVSPAVGADPDGEWLGHRRGHRRQAGADLDECPCGGAEHESGGALQEYHRADGPCAGGVP